MCFNLFFIGIKVSLYLFFFVLSSLLSTVCNTCIFKRRRSRHSRENKRNISTALSWRPNGKVRRPLHTVVHTIIDTINTTSHNEDVY